MTVEPQRPHAGAGHALRWSLFERADGATVVFAGEVDENADFSSLRRSLAGAVEFHLAGITRVNSCGVREWVNFVRALPPSVTSLRFSHCSSAIVTQLNAICNFRGAARVLSLHAPYVCERCGIEEHKLLEVEGGGIVGAEASLARLDEDARVGEALRCVPRFTCARCAGPMEFDELPERYLSFLREP